MSAVAPRAALALTSEKGPHPDIMSVCCQRLRELADAIDEALCRRAECPEDLWGTPRSARLKERQKQRTPQRACTMKPYFHGDRRFWQSRVLLSSVGRGWSSIAADL